MPTKPNEYSPEYRAVFGASNAELSEMIAGGFEPTSGSYAGWESPVERAQFALSVLVDRASGDE